MGSPPHAAGCQTQFPATQRGATLKCMGILISGATGFVGSHLAQALIQAGERVYALVRTSSDVSALQESGAQLIYNDHAEDADSLETTLSAYSDIRIIYHLASVLTLAKLKYKDYWNVNVGITKNLLEVSRRLQRLQAFVYCSSVGVIGPLPEIPANEQTRCAPDSYYAKTKYEAECLSLDYARNYNLPVTAVRLAWVYGPGDRRTFKIFEMIAKKHFAIIGDGQTRISPMHVTDAAQALMLCAKQIDQTRGEAFIAAGNAPVPLAEFAALIAKECGVSLPPFHIPAWLAKLAAQICEGICVPIGVEPFIHHNRLNFFLRHQAFDISKIQRTVGYAPRVDLPDGIRETVAWYRKEGWI